MTTQTEKKALKQQLTNMLIEAGFKNSVAKRMANRIVTAKSTTHAEITSRWIQKNDKNRALDWMEQIQRRFQLDLDDIKKSLKTNPVLLLSNPETLHGNACDIRYYLKQNNIHISLKDLCNTSVLKSGILSRDSKTIANHITELTCEFKKCITDLNTTYFVKKILKGHAKLLEETPRHLKNNMGKIISLLKQSGFPVSNQEYYNAATKHSGLIYQSPETICSHFSILYNLYAANLCRISDKDKTLNQPTDMVTRILKDPARLCLSDENLASRWVYACRSKHEDKKTLGYNKLISTSKSKVAKTIASYQCPLEKTLNALLNQKTR